MGPAFLYCTPPNSRNFCEDREWELESSPKKLSPLDDIDFLAAKETSSGDRQLHDTNIRSIPLCRPGALAMSGKQAAKGAGGKGKKGAKGGAEEKREDVLQAVVCSRCASNLLGCN